MRIAWLFAHPELMADPHVSNLQNDILAILQAAEDRVRDKGENPELD